jgi:Tol biopolymer transport system component
VIFSEQREGAANILEVPFSAKTPALTAAPHRLTLGMTREDDPSLSADGRLVFASITYNVDVYSLAIDPNLGKVTGPLQRLTTDAATDRTPSISMDGTRIAFNSGRLGAEGIWTKNLKTGKESPLVRPTVSVPFVSPDGSLVAWDVSGPQILSEPFDGGATRRICQDCGNICGWSTDGKKLLFTDYSSHSFVGVLDIASGQKTILKHPKLSVYPRSFSPDDRWIAATAENPLKIVIVPFRPGQPVAEADWIQVTDGVHRDGGPRWAPDGKLLYFTSDRDGLTCIWAQPLDPDTKHPVGEPFAVFHIHGALLRMRPYITPFSLSKDKVVFSLEERAGNIWMLKQ